MKMLECFTGQCHLEIKTKVSEFFNFWHNRPSILCNTSFSTNLSTLMSLELLFYVSMSSRV